MHFESEEFKRANFDFRRRINPRRNDYFFVKGVVKEDRIATGMINGSASHLGDIRAHFLNRLEIIISIGAQISYTDEWTSGKARALAMSDFNLVVRRQFH